MKFYNTIHPYYCGIDLHARSIHICIIIPALLNYNSSICLTSMGADMDTLFHTMNNLFAQLGLPDDDMSIEAFIGEHHHLDNNIRLDNASFWTAAQARFLREAFQEDSDWAEVVDQLDARLRH